jgi:hypothetical protein
VCVTVAVVDMVAFVFDWNHFSGKSKKIAEVIYVK